MNKKFLTLFLIIFTLIFTGDILAADVADDDSTPYMPTIPGQNSGNNSNSKTPAKNQSSKRSVRKAPVKKSTPKKSTAKKSATTNAKKTTQAPAKLSSLQQGIALMKQERYEAARPFLQKAVQEERNNPEAWYWYGMYHEKTGAFSQAQYFYSKAVTIDPSFSPLSRVVNYPEDDNKIALYDPKRPPRVYPVQVENNTATAVPAGSSQSKKLPSKPTANDPDLPRVPVYTPPEPNSNPLDGDAWRPAVYVPPPANQNANVQSQKNSPVYFPPSSPKTNEQQNLEPVPVGVNVVAKERTALNDLNSEMVNEKPAQNTTPEIKKQEHVIVIDTSKNDTSTQIIKPEPENTPEPEPEPTKNLANNNLTQTGDVDKYTIIKGGNIFYNPENNTARSNSETVKPAEDNSKTVNAPAKKSTSTKKTTTTSAKTPAKKSTATSTRKSTASNKAQANKNNQTVQPAPQPTQPTQRKATSQDLTPKAQTPAKQQSQPVTPKNQPTTTPKAQQAKPAQPKTQTPATPPAKKNAPENSKPNGENDQEKMPPVGQFQADPGTLDEKPMPPVGQ